MKKNVGNFKESLNRLCDWQVFNFFIIGLGAGLPLLLIFSSLSLWLKQAGIARADITFFSWAALGYGFKYVWAPLIDRLPVPLIAGKFGQRRGWLIASQLAVILSLLGMALSNPEAHIYSLAAFAVLLGFSSATQDIVIDAYRIESSSEEMQGLLASTYVAGYRVGMIIAGAGLLELVAANQINPEIYEYSVWRMGYIAMAGVMFLPIIIVLFMKEPKIAQRAQAEQSFSAQEYLRFFFGFILAAIALIFCFWQLGSLLPNFENRFLTISMEFLRLSLGIGAAALVVFILFKLNFTSRPLFNQGYALPVFDFFKRYKLSSALIILATIGFYRAPDIIMGTTANLFYVDMGFQLTEISRISKTFGLVMTIMGGILGGFLVVRFGVSKILLLGIALAASTNVLFSLLSVIGHNVTALTLVIVADNLSSGLASIAFVAWLSRLTNIKFTAMQYAIFSSLMVIGPKFLGGYSGGMVDAMGYNQFFIMTAFIGIPVFILALVALRLEQKPE